MEARSRTVDDDEGGVGELQAVAEGAPQPPGADGAEVAVQLQPAAVLRGTAMKTKLRFGTW
jgi:hypothetical protein